MRLSLSKPVALATLLLLGCGIGFAARASTTDGTVDATNRYAWSENTGWIDFGSTAGNIHITDSALTGYAWGENIGWVSLNCSNTSSCATVDYKVANNNEGTLSGYAWSENAGWIQFDPSAGGVTINSSGVFSGYAWGENIGWISFNCSNTTSCATVDYKISTDWRPASARSTPSTTTSGGGNLGFVPAPAPPSPTSTPPAALPPEAPPPEEAASSSLVSRLPEGLRRFIPAPFRREPAPVVPSPPPPLVSREAPPAFRGVWNLVDLDPVRAFVLAPLPREVRVLTQKFPTLEAVLHEVGVERIADLQKLQAVKLKLPGISEIAAVPEGRVAPGALEIPKGIPLANLGPEFKRRLPSEVLFVRGAAEFVDVPVRLTVDEAGVARQRIQTISGTALLLSVRIEQPVKAVRGFVVFKKKVPRPSSLLVPRESLSASLFFASAVFAEEQRAPVRAEEEFVLVEFEYADPDGDGIYTAQIQAPAVDGEYEIITVMDYEDPSLGVREIRLTTVVDPEGYIFEQSGRKEVRIPDAEVSLFLLDPQSGQFALWPAKEFRQANPQVTDVRGTYSFLVPEGTYRLEISAPGYRQYVGEPFVVEEGTPVHENVALRATFSFLTALSWQSALLVALVLLLLYNFYRDRMRERASRDTSRGSQ
ncbi:MAG: hypothetical protein HY436_00275 [Candidatus Liptonbacteria bacterium]|nr:hypothetical protein [Candidatus Liptonbacteria bacterium]